LALRVPKIESPQLLDSQPQAVRPLDSVVLIRPTGCLRCRL
jgi:hypothetical protein